MQLRPLPVFTKPLKSETNPRNTFFHTSKRSRIYAAVIDMASTSRTLEITGESGENLQNNRKPPKKNAFVVIRTDSHNVCTTKMDADCGSYPLWNEKLAVDVPVHAGLITMEVQCKTSIGNKTVGTARVTVSDFLRWYVPQSYWHFLSYRPRDSNGEGNGFINISVRVKVPEYATCSGTGMGVPAVGRQELWWSCDRDSSLVYLSGKILMDLLPERKKIEFIFHLMQLY